MDASIAASEIRILALGNELLADDAFGIVVARKLRRRFAGALDVVVTSEAGFRLMDHLLGVQRVVVVDTVRTGRTEPGTLHVVAAEDVDHVRGASPHAVGLFETLEAARAMRLPVATEVVIVAVEAADCETIGGPMTSAVDGAVDVAVRRIVEMVSEDGHA
ncbi:MAG: hydrogenase maturation protease [Candidatus Eiseniibacteriota bacterium]